MSVDLFERYKDALRRGHVAAMRGRLDEALTAYGEAAALAPERAVPWASMGTVHLRLGDADAALAAFDTALARAARDEAGLRGRAEALSRLGRRVEGAETLDQLSEVQEAAGKLPDALDAARRALELAEQRTRRRHVQTLTRRLRDTAGAQLDQAAQQALAKALRILEPIESQPAGAGETDASAPGGAALATTPGAGDGVAGAGGAAPGPIGTAAGTGSPGSDAAPAGGGGAVAAAAAPEPVAAPAVVAEPEPGGLELVAAAEAALDARDTVTALREYLAAARAFGREGLLAAALDACYLALAIGPADPELHLELAELYLDLGWDTRAADKLVLLAKLIDLDGDTVARERLCALVDAWFSDDPRLAAVCA